MKIFDITKGYLEAKYVKVLLNLEYIFILPKGGCSTFADL